jgi:hypothetical protein
MKGRAHRQHDRAPRSALGGEFDRLPHRLGMAADDDLAGAVVVGDDANAVAGGARGDLARGVDVETEERGHRALADRHRGLHRLAAPLDEAHRVGDREGAGRSMRRIFAERVPGDIGEPGYVEPGLALEHADDREARGEQRRLGVFGEGEVALRPLEHQPREALRQRVVDLFEEQPGGRKGLGQVATHAGMLRPLAGKNKSTFHRQARPPAFLAFVIDPPSGESSRRRSACGRFISRPLGLETAIIE